MVRYVNISDDDDDDDDDDDIKFIKKTPLHPRERLNVLAKIT